MNTKTKLAVALAATISSGIASAAEIQMYLDVGVINTGAGAGNIGSGASSGTPFGNPGNSGIFSPDADTITGLFTEFGFNQFRATSLYEKDAGGAFTGNILDTNNAAFLSGSNPVIPAPSFGQVTLGNLSPLTPPQVPFSATEGFGTTWGLSVDYQLNGTIPTDGSNFLGLPSYTTGIFNIWFDDYANNTGLNDGTNRDVQVLGLILDSASILPADVILTYELVFAHTGFLNIGGVDAADQIGRLFRLDTNIDPPIPNPTTLIDVIGQDGNNYAYRSTNLDGTVSPIPEPASLALLGIGILGLAANKRKTA
ncbi:PEP-CTERM sorting domain-containing protein [Methylomonas rivi]|uniref:PEP-CTERM sorting domain-containing protein n=1 Tax=Methylomonas rivi TaxID=2952226 RepID=A0ABT1U9P3_9GAMM|nr:PEP-CTERM sorting domain-containing protein [Methylomonas sp. WSC-6]MCQ8130233.1 PEP-CTERM sorting domain-containing protein [Methylomonas sp. WSC-6]